MKKPLLIRRNGKIIISLNGKKLIKPETSKYKIMTNQEILNEFLNGSG